MDPPRPVLRGISRLFFFIVARGGEQGPSPKVVGETSPLMRKVRAADATHSRPGRLPEAPRAEGCSAAGETPEASAKAAGPQRGSTATLEPPARARPLGVRGD